jgi:hypothetical protein
MGLSGKQHERQVAFGVRISRPPLIAIIICCALTLVTVLYLRFFRKQDPRLTDEEIMLLSLVDEQHYDDLLHYIRTFEMSAELSDYLATNKMALKALSYYAKRYALEEQMKRGQRLVQESQTQKANLSDGERKIITRLKNNRL